MARYALAMALSLLAVAAMLPSSLALPSPDEERYVEKEYNRELINLLNAVQYAPQQLGNLCKYPYFFANSLRGPMPKRNSELINSLLSLPKNMNDAGK
ncbi:protein PDF [Scaptodrosophila lebanonensis]|uniref:Protein PDF n=1 Tax=Drosophila lebanonensis TaxID=7225 RepID=A0A6J2TM03_DROLE|nr:protein PDF [Scaptodrosophila lebanonensis]